MRRSFSIFTAAAMVSLILSGCGNKTENELLPLLGLSWFMAYDDVKEKMDGYVLLDEREKDDKILQEILRFVLQSRDLSDLITMI